MDSYNLIFCEITWLLKYKKQDSSNQKNDKKFPGFQGLNSADINNAIVQKFITDQRNKKTKEKMYIKD